MFWNGKSLERDEGVVGKDVRSEKLCNLNTLAQIFEKSMYVM